MEYWVVGYKGFPNESNPLYWDIEGVEDRCSLTDERIDGPYATFSRAKASIYDEIALNMERLRERKSYLARLRVSDVTEKPKSESEGEKQ